MKFILCIPQIFLGGDWNFCRFFELWKFGLQKCYSLWQITKKLVEIQKFFPHNMAHMNNILLKCESFHPQKCLFDVTFSNIVIVYWYNRSSHRINYCCCISTIYFSIGTGKPWNRETELHQKCTIKILRVVYDSCTSCTDSEYISI